MEEERCKKKKVDTRDELLARILHVVARIKKREDQCRRTTRNLRTRIAKRTEVGGDIFVTSTVNRNVACCFVWV
jgi:hypothetical protein